ncbi:spore coat protein GerQ [Shouchella lonarensis]|uniref:Spore germination protein Q n=1 Tax=Shouchella lonarensis TaxID=1464122 RepID=A0A1G6GV90_9BACI|nr:spore coat protein GerQ [Shouchella lonarensis]SDB85899.1 spore germination protein Q [Shouchella lonarensis]
MYPHEWFELHRQQPVQQQPWQQQPPQQQPPQQQQPWQQQPPQQQQPLQQPLPQPPVGDQPGYFSAQQYQVPGFVQQQQQQQPTPPIPGMLPIEQSFIENILRLNRGKQVTVYQTFEGNNEWNARIFRGRIEEAGRDHIILGNPQTNEHYLLLMVNLDYVTFDEPITYEYPFGQPTPPLTQYSPRPE